MSNILFIGNAIDPLGKERYQLISENVKYNQIYFLDNGFNNINKNYFFSYKKKNKYIDSFYLFFKILQIINSQKINVIHFHGAFQVFLNLLPFFISNKIKIIVNVNSSEINQNYKGYKKYFVKYLLKKSKYITVKSNFMKQLVLNIINNSAKIVNLNWGVDDQLFKLTNNRINSEKVNIISFRATKEIYNIDKIFNAIFNLKTKFSNINFTYVEFNKDQNINLDLSIVDNYFYNLSKKELFDLLANQDIMISIPSFDGFATSIMESLAIGVKPCISNIVSYKNEELTNLVSFIDLSNEKNIEIILSKNIENIELIREEVTMRKEFAFINYSRKEQIQILKRIYNKMENQ